MRGTGISCLPGCWRSTGSPIYLESFLAPFPERHSADGSGHKRNPALHHGTRQLKHPTGDAAKRYNPLQRLAYLGIIILIS